MPALRCQAALAASETRSKRISPTERHPFRFSFHQLKSSERNDTTLICRQTVQKVQRHPFVTYLNQVNRIRNRETLTTLKDQTLSRGRSGEVLHRIRDREERSSLTFPYPKHHFGTEFYADRQWARSKRISPTERHPLISQPKGIPKDTIQTPTRFAVAPFATLTLDQNTWCAGHSVLI
jgi:hypothetical protein